MLRKRTGLASTALTAGLALALAACGGGSDDDGGGSDSGSTTVAKGGVLKVLSEEDVPSLDNAGLYDTNSNHLFRTFGRQLYANPASNSLDARSENIPDLAEALPVLSNGDKTYTIKIKQGVQWNSQPARQITAEDAVRGLKFTCNPVEPFGAFDPYFTGTIVGMTEFCDGFANVDQASAPALKAYAEGTPIAGVKAVDPSTLQIDLKEPAADFIKMLAQLPTMAPRPIEALEYVPGSPEYKQNIIESGPYQIQSYVPDKSYVLTRNPAWKPETDKLRQANVDSIEITLGVDAESIQQQIQAGTADMALGVTAPPAAALATLSRNQDPGLHLNPTGSQNPYIVMNIVGPNPALDNVKVRQAINYATNKRNVVQVAGGSLVAKANGQFFTPSVVGAGFEEQDLYKTPDFAGDPAKAKQLLAEAGYPNGLNLTLAYRASGNNPKYAETLVQDFKASGITLTPKEVVARDFYTRFLQKPEIAAAGEWDIALPGWSPDWEGAAERTFFSALLDGRAYGEGSTNYGGYNNDTINAAADKALATIDRAEAVKQWNAIDRMIMEDAPIVPIFEQTQANYVSARLKNYQFVAGGNNGDMNQVGVQ
jgi:peptide/nickel transport system substrate-binding protein